MPRDLPPIPRVSYHDLAREVAGSHPRAEDLCREAVTIRQLQDVQTACDQLARTAEDRRQGLPDPYNQPLSYHIDETLKHARHLRDVLWTAAGTADLMIERLSGRVTDLEVAMNDQDPPVNPEHTPRPEDQDPPKLTTTGGPHPLVQGGYDPDADPARPASEGDVAALKAGHGTKATTEAQNAALAENQAGQEPTKVEDTQGPDELPLSSPAPQPEKGKSTRGKGK